MLPFSFSEFNWRLIFLMITVSAVVSYVGDVVGMKIGKKRISFLGLRPRYTSTIITIMTGIAIAVVTLGVAAGTSDSVRGALYGVNFLQREVSRLMTESRKNQELIDENQVKLDVVMFDLLENQRQLERLGKDLLEASDDLRGTREKLQAAELQTRKAEDERKGLLSQMEGLKAERLELEKSVTSLRAESQNLKKGLAQMQEGKILVSGGELLSQVSIPGGSSKSDIEAAMVRLTHQAEEMIALKLQETMNKGIAPRVLISEESKKAVEKALNSSEGIKVLRLTALSNIVQGQVVTGVIQIFDRKLVFKEGELLSRVTLKGGMEPERAADLLYTFLKQINGRAVERGVLQDPISGAVGNLDSIEFYSAADEMSETKGDFTITFSAASDIYTEGPVNVKISIEASRK